MIGEVVGENEFVPVMTIIFVIFMVVRMLLVEATNKFYYRTKKGLEVSRYMDGLKLYIEMT